MIHIPCEQGSAEWVKARSGIPTASQFSRLVTPAKLKPSSQMTGYAYEIVAERLCGGSFDSISSEWMERGKEMEEQARAWYEFQQEATVEPGGFCTVSDGSAGCSPDGLIGDSGGLEIKCLSAANHIDVLVNGIPDKYLPQVQGCLFVTGRQWWDFVAFNPSLPPRVIREVPRANWVAALTEALQQLREEIDTAMGVIREKGYVEKSA